ncbi:MAG TPA: xanthine dehydrogenase family protein molybdopterin-binding subunit [Streptosporangiaceae bacterium]
MDGDRTGVLGTRVLRIEDQRLLTVGGTYVDDLDIPELAGAARVTFVRSPLAHALVTAVDASAARGEPGVIAVLTGEDAPPLPDEPLAEPLLAGERVRFVGEPVAMVITDGQYRGEDAAELVSVDYEPLPAVASLDDALADETLLFPATGSNVAGAAGAEDSTGDALFEGCEVVVGATIVNQRVAPVPLEVRGAAATWADDRLTMWASTQNSQLARFAVAGTLGLPPDAVRIITPDVGGGFGAKIAVDREHLAVAWATRHLGRPLRWSETRSENMVAMTHGRAQRQEITIGGTRDGKILAYRFDFVQDSGAYPRAGFLPSLTRLMTSGAYLIPRVECSYKFVLTSTTPIAAYRGAGRPEATAAVERAVDLFAAGIGMDPAEVRRLNVVPPDRFPYTTPTGATYDTGDYAVALDKVLAAAGYGELRAEQAARRERGDRVQLGLGLATYVEITAGDGGGESGRIDIHEDGTATVFTGSSAHGQGHATAWSMLVQEELGIAMGDVTVVHGDTDIIPTGIGTFGSRSLQLGGAAVHKAAGEVKEQARGLAAELAGVTEQDMEFDPRLGVWRVHGESGTDLEWGKIAGAAGPDGLTADVMFTAASPTFPFGAHLAVVEVDTETGKVTLVRHVTVDDAGVLVNPLLAEGQRHGGIAQGAAQALLEEVVYDADGNPLTGTLADYAIITATELPSFELVDSQTPTGINPLGVKGIGEAGTIGSTPAVQNAVVDAVAHLGVRHIDMPTTPQRVWAAIREAANTKAMDTKAEAAR